MIIVQPVKIKKLLSRNDREALVFLWRKLLAGFLYADGVGKSRGYKSTRRMAMLFSLIQENPYSLSSSEYFDHVGHTESLLPGTLVDEN